MDGELFVVNILKCSDKALSAVSPHVSGTDSRAVLKVLHDERRLAAQCREIRATPQELFIKLRAAILGAFNRKPLLRMTRDRAKLLLSADVQAELAKILGCPAHDVLQNLLSVEELRRSWSYLAGTLATAANAMALYGEIIGHRNAHMLEMRCNTGQNDWEPIFEEERWLNPGAITAIMGSTRLQVGRTAVERLVELMDRKIEEEKYVFGFFEGSKRTIGPIGMLELRRRLAWIVSRIVEQAIDSAEKASSTLPESPNLRLLAVFLHLEGIGNLSRGLRDYLNQRTPLRALLPADCFNILPGPDDLEIRGDEPLVFQVTSKFGSDGETLVNFDIACRVEGHDAPQPMLHAQGVPAWICDHLHRDIPKLRPDNLAGSQISELAEELLDFPFPILEGPIQRLHDGIAGLGVGFYQAAALSCAHPILEVPRIWKESLNGKPYHRDLPISGDPSFPKSVSGIVDHFRSQYRDPHDPLRIERGLAPAAMV